MNVKSGAILVAALGLGALLIGGPSVAHAQARWQVAQSKPTQGGSVPGPNASLRTETTTFDAWTVTCQEAVGASSKKTCIAFMRVLSSDGKMALLNWQIGFDKDRRLTSAFQVPLGISLRDEKQGATLGLLLKDGLDFKAGNGAVRKISYVTCNPQICEAALPMDEAFTKQILAGAGTISVMAYAPDGRPIPLTFDAKGVNKAIEAIRTAN